jgi:1-deoxy-D-xylulose-5-phosphate synthase
MLAVGVMCQPAMEAAELLAADGLDVTVVNCRFIKPLDHGMLETLVRDHRILMTVEDGTEVTGFGAFAAATCERIDPQVRVEVVGIPDRTYEHAPRAEQLAWVGLSPEGLADRVRSWAAEESLTPR